MFSREHIAGEPETPKALAFVNALTAFASLQVLGFPLTTATIRTMVLSWLLMTVAIMRLGSKYSKPLLRFMEIRQ